MSLTVTGRLGLLVIGLSLLVSFAVLLSAYWQPAKRQEFARTSVSRPPATIAPERFVNADAAHGVRPDELVLGVSNGDVAKAYPIRLLAATEHLNDTLARIPVLATW